MSISINTRQAYAEIDEFLRLLSEEQKNEIPKKLRDFFKEEKDQGYRKTIDATVPIAEQNLKEETLAIIALLNLQYWCKDEEEKQRLKKIYAQNEEKYQEMMQQKFNTNDIFKKKADMKVESNEAAENMQMVAYQEPLFKRIFHKIKNFFHLK